jgi:hypothetical protein
MPAERTAVRATPSLEDLPAQSYCGGEVRGHHLRRGPGRLSLVAGVFGCILIAGLFLVGRPASAHRDPSSASSGLFPQAASGSPAACTDPTDRSPERTTVQTGQNPVCGTIYNDRWTVPKNVDDGISIWGYAGKDVIRARNGKSEWISGGDGDDEGWFDSCDHIGADVEKKHVSKKPCPGVKKQSKKSRRLGAKAVVYPLRIGAMIECTVDSAGRRLVRISEEPEMRAVDTTKQVDYQFVAYSPVLYQLNGSQWTAVAQDPWLWDHAYDEQIEAFPGNFWRRLDNNQRWFLWFYPQGPGIYRVGLNLKWYAQGKLPDHEESQWARAHYGPYEVRTGEYRHQACQYTS